MEELAKRLLGWGAKILFGRWWDGSRANADKRKARKRYKEAVQRAKMRGLSCQVVEALEIDAVFEEAYELLLDGASTRSIVERVFRRAVTGQEDTELLVEVIGSLREVQGPRTAKEKRIFSVVKSSSNEASEKVIRELAEHCGSTADDQAGLRTSREIADRVGRGLRLVNDQRDANEELGVVDLAELFDTEDVELIDRCLAGEATEEIIALAETISEALGLRKEWVVKGRGEPFHFCRRNHRQMMKVVEEGSFERLLFVLSREQRHEAIFVIDWNGIRCEPTGEIGCALSASCGLGCAGQESLLEYFDILARAWERFPSKCGSAVLSAEEFNNAVAGKISARIAAKRSGGDFWADDLRDIEHRCCNEGFSYERWRGSWFTDTQQFLADRYDEWLRRRYPSLRKPSLF